MTESRHPMSGYLASKNIYLPWDGLKEGQSFFVPGADEKDRASIRMAAARRGIKISTRFTTEKNGVGLRVMRRK